jgi:hypothetical protein
MSDTFNSRIGEFKISRSREGRTFYLELNDNEGLTLYSVDRIIRVHKYVNSLKIVFLPTEFASPIEMLIVSTQEGLNNPKKITEGYNFVLHIMSIINP